MNFLKGIKGSVLLFMALLLLSPIVFANGNESTGTEKGKSMENRYGMQARYDHIACQVDFTKNTIDNVVGKVPDAATQLNQYKEDLTGELNALKGYLDSKDKEQFNSYVKSTLHQKMIDASKAVKDSLHGKNVTKDTRKAIQDQFSADRRAFAACNANTAKTFAQEKVQKMKDDLDEWDKKIDNLSARGINVDDMKKIVSDARSMAVDPVSNEVNGATTGDAIKAALQKYCLADGCKDGVNFHFFAKMDIARLNALVSYLEGTGKTLDQTALAQLKADIDAANSALASVGTSDYTEATRAAAWDSIKKASEDLRDLVKKSREEAKEGRQNAREKIKDAREAVKEAGDKDRGESE